MDYNITLTANHQSLTAKYLPLAAESVQYLTAKVVYETDDWTGREIKAMFGRGCTVYEVPVTGGEITAKQQLNLTAGDWRVWLVGNSARDGDVIPRITTNVAHIIVAPTGGTEGSPFPAIPPTVEEQLRADMGNLADLTTEDKSSLVAAINEVRQTGGGGVQSDWNQNDETAPDYVKNRPFYTGDPVETVLVEESTVSFSFNENEGLYVGGLESTFSATVGETYKVSWDGAAYECTCVKFNNKPAIGNLSIVGAGSDTGEPFIIDIFRVGRIDIATQNTSASHTVSISRTVVPVVKIDPKYIRDMYYTGDPVETVLVEKSTVSFAEGGGGKYQGDLPSTFSPTVGETYKVYWDGAAYECTCVNFNNRLIIGNLYIIEAGSDTGEPFVMAILNGGGIGIVTADTSASHTIFIRGYAESVVKIDQKYLPVASETEPGIISITPLSNYILQQVDDEYFSEIHTQVWNYGDAAIIKECADKNNSHGIFSPGKLEGAVLSCDDNAVNKYITSVLSGGKNIECWKFSLGSTTMERLWGIFEDGVVISSSTADSTKKFKITVDDSGVLKATEVS